MEPVALQMKESTYKRVMNSIIPEPNSGCWIWLGAKTNKGYGHIRASGKWWLVHRFMYTYHKGEIPNGWIIRHTCDNIHCANPDHLLVGTARENVYDQIERGRFKPRRGQCKPVEYYRRKHNV